MKQAKYKTKEELIEKIKEKKELRGIATKIVKESLEKYIKKHKIFPKRLPHSDSKTIIKDVRAELRNLSGQYKKSFKNRSKLLKENKIEELLKTHTSTSERIEYYSKLTKLIENLKIKSILDLGCGINPIALANKKIKYHATDINEEDLSLVREHFKKNRIKGSVFVYDLRKVDPNLPETDLCLIFKALDIIAKGEERKRITEKILKNVKSRFFLISFSTKKKLSGRRMNSPRRTWFEAILSKLKLKSKKIETENEVFYMFSK